MKNRISVALDPQDVAEFEAAQEVLNRILLKWLKSADLSEVGPGNYMGTEGGWQYCQDGYEFATNYPKVYDDEELNYEEYKKDILMGMFIIRSMRQQTEIDNRLSSLFNLLGKDLMEQTHYIRKRGNDKRKINVEYAAPSDKLNMLYEKRNDKAEATKKANEQINALKAQLTAVK